MVILSIKLAYGVNKLSEPRLRQAGADGSDYYD